MTLTQKDRGNLESFFGHDNDTLFNRMTSVNGLDNFNMREIWKSARKAEENDYQEVPELKYKIESSMEILRLQAQQARLSIK